MAITQNEATEPSWNPPKLPCALNINPHTSTTNPILSGRARVWFIMCLIYTAPFLDTKHLPDQASNSLTHSPIHSLNHSLIQSLPHSVTHSPTHSFNHSLTDLLTQSATHSITHFLSHLFTYMLTHSLTHSPVHSPILTFP